MFESITLARPYARAVFDFAAEQQTTERQSIDNWQGMLAFAAEVARNDDMTELLSGGVSSELLSKKFIAICGEQLDEYAQNLIRIMAENGRLALFPEIFQQFVQLRAAQEAIISVEVISAVILNDEQQANITAAMTKRLASRVKLNYKIDKSIIAGMIIRAGDKVIDSSVRGRLERLADVLQS